MEFKSRVCHRYVLIRATPGCPGFQKSSLISVDILRVTLYGEGGEHSREGSNPALAMTFSDALVPLRGDPTIAPRLNWAPKEFRLCTSFWPMTHLFPVVKHAKFLSFQQHQVFYTVIFWVLELVRSTWTQTGLWASNSRQHNVSPVLSS